MKRLISNTAMYFGVIAVLGLSWAASSVLQIYRCGGNESHLELRVGACNWLLNAYRVEDGYISSFLYTSRGTAKLLMGEFSAGKEDLDRAIRYDQENIEPVKRRARLLFIQQKYEEELLSDAGRWIIHDQSDFYPYLIKGSVLYERKNYGLAAKYLAKALEIAPEDTQSLGLYGSALMQQESFEEAIASFDAALEIDSEQFPVILKRAVSYYKLGQVKNAIADVSEALRISPESHGSLYLRSIMLQKIGEYEKALDDVNRAISISKSHPTYYTNRSNIYVALGNFEKAIEGADWAVQQFPDDALAFYTRGWANYNIGNIELALEDYKKAKKVNPDKIWFWYDEYSSD